MTPKVSTGFARRLLVTVAAIAFASVAFIQSSGAQVTSNSFAVLDNPNDPMFNQLLGINDQQIIVGYYGDGMVVANHGYVLVPKTHYSVEDFTNLPAGGVASQTQAIGISNTTITTDATTKVVTVHLPRIVGFYQEPGNANTAPIHGFLDANGIQSTLDDPAGSPPNVARTVQNLLGINNTPKGAGFWTDNNGHEHGFIVEINAQNLANSTFREIPPSTFAGAVSTQATSINNNSQVHPGQGDLVCGFWTDANGNNHGFTVFLTQQGFAQFNPLTLPGVTATSVSPFGCNDQGRVVGSFTGNQGNIHGFIFDTTDFHIYDAKGSSQRPAFGVQGTFINGVNNKGAIVGFFSDGDNVNGFVDFAPVQ